ncbi:MAG: galactitol-1-phosphate 5-dehydrogenase [Candidatus Hydrogenedentes bacterium]|nr:galactitol-1-phosphate 5-dehydrogenase [Candidatus Hydrogenedentota bacterium]
MKALRLYAPGDIRFEEVPTPFPKQDEMLIRVLACGVCGSDIPRVFDNWAHRYPLIPGHEFSGEVVEVGGDTGKDWIGKRVVIYPLIPCGKCSACYSGLPTQCINYDYLGSRRDGGFAEYVAVPRDNVIPVPEGISGEVSALTEPSAVALRAVRKSSINAGDTVLIVGVGTIGLLIGFWAQLAGASVMMMDVVIEKLRFAKKLGFQYLVDANQPDVVDWVRKRSDMGVDVVFETSGHYSGLEKAIMSARVNGKIVLVGNPIGDKISIESKVYGEILRRELSIIGIWNSNRLEYPKNEWSVVLQEFRRERVPFEKLITHKVSLSGMKDLLFDIYRKKVFPIKAMYINNEE